jgi:hypothetical protein
MFYFMIDILFWNWIVTTVELPLSVASQFKGTCGERKSNHGEAVYAE